MSENWLCSALSAFIGVHRRPILLLSSVAAVATLLADTRLPDFSALEAFETRFEAKLNQTPPPFPFEVMTPAPAVYVPGVGAVLSTVVSLSYVPPPSPFRGPSTPQERATYHERKVQRLPILEANMREVMADTASNIDTLPLNERIVIGVTLFYFKWEDSSGLPRQIVMSAEKQKLLQARRDKVDLATVIQELKL